MAANERHKKTAPLDSSLDDLIITWVDIDKEKKVVAFSAEQVTYNGEQVYPVIRYDTSHGYCHVHRFYKELNPAREDIHKPIDDKTFYECRRDIKENWKKYKKEHFNRFIK